MTAKNWLLWWSFIVLTALTLIGLFVYKMDPFFHYHKPDIDNYYYEINSQRNQNDGISKHFEYDALITGTSMTENFLTSEFDEMFEVNSIKVPFSGGSFKEINDNLKNALKYNNNLRIVIRGLDVEKIMESPDKMREDLGSYPTYLYDSNPFNDVYYLLNKDVIFDRAYNIIQAKKGELFSPGITSFDSYSRWQEWNTFGIHEVYNGIVDFKGMGNPVHLTNEEKENIYDNITQNVTALADEYPATEFYYFFTPYSILHYKSLVEDGSVFRQIEAEQYAIELILEHSNIRLFSYNNVEAVVTDINNYKDYCHYASWINSFILKSMKNGEYQLTKENYESYLKSELELFLKFDYISLNNQIDYEDDLYSAALINEKIWGVKPIDVVKDCNYINSGDNTGIEITIKDVGKHNYLTFYGKKGAYQIEPIVKVIDNKGSIVGECVIDYQNLDTEWHQYVMDLNGIESDITILIENGSLGKTCTDSRYLFDNIILY